MPIYNLNGKTYNIPDDVVNDFENDNPDARIQYSAGGKKYDIPVSEKQGFLEAFPDAKYREQEKPAIPQRKTQSSPGAVEAKNGYEFTEEGLNAVMDEGAKPVFVSTEAKPKLTEQAEDPFFTKENPSPLKPEDAKEPEIPLLFKEKAKEAKRLSQDPKLNSYLYDRQREAMRRVADPSNTSFEYRMGGLKEAKEAEAARQMNRADYDKQNFEDFYGKHVAPVFGEERETGEQQAKGEISKIMGVGDMSNVPQSPSGLMSGIDHTFKTSVAKEKYTDPEKIASRTLRRVQDDEAFGDYVLSRMGINGQSADGEGDDSPQLSEHEKEWMKRLFEKETGEVSNQIIQRIYDTYQQEEAPQGVLDYITGKAFRENMVSSLYGSLVQRAANSSGIRDQLRAMAAEEYGKDQSWATRVAGGAAPFAVDMISGGFALPNVVGQALVKGGTKLAAREVTKKMAERAAARGLTGEALKEAASTGGAVAERYLATQAPIVNLALRTAGSAANFATYDTQGELIRQYAQGEFKPFDLMKEAARGVVLGAAVGALGSAVGHATRHAGTLGKVSADI